ncbi:hypothetical protein AVEN_119116-1, partial [Araneus ventricosus]
GSVHVCRTMGQHSSLECSMPVYKFL